MRSHKTTTNIQSQEMTFKATARGKEIDQIDKC